ncbi:MAG: S8 family serine peptidase, partial [Bryobacteraceae bacterium]|nr:S8 family serine peptidase [Bryobacteraceae bacterium]
FRTDTILQAIDDAVKDGMDVINMSLGAPGVTLTEDEIITVAINRAVEAGVIVVTAAGNAGPDPVTVGDTGAVTNAISVGSSDNDRVPASPQLVIPATSTTFTASAASNSAGAPQIRGSLRDAGLACGPVTGLEGRIALIQRGDCTFETKFQNAAGAGALAVVVYNNQAEPARITMEVGAARLQGLLVSQGDGESVKQRLAAEPELEFLMLFSDFAPIDPDVVSDFSGRGPTLNLEIKPDLVAVGGAVITADSGTETNRPETSGYVLSAGTSLSAPAVAGAAAVLKAARPGLRVSQYRSLLINSATRFPVNREDFQVQQTGAGMLNLPGALTTNTTISPVSISFGEYRGQSISRQFTISNLGRSAESYTLTLLTADTLRPRISGSTLTVESGDSASLTLQLDIPNPAAGQYQGIIEIAGSSGSLSRVPYWAGVRSSTPSRISVAGQPFTANTGGTAQILFRVLDSGAFYLLEPAAEITAVSGGGAVVSVNQLGAQYPGLYLARVRLGPEPGVNVFRIHAAGAEREVRIRGER